MGVKPRFIAKIEKGALKFNNPDAVSTYLRGFSVGQELDVVISKPTRHRSTPQNDWYWGAILPIISRETGHTVEELHEIFKRKFLPRKTVRYRDQDIVMPGSSADCTTIEFSEYIERIRSEVADMGITIPEAGDFSN